MHKYDFNEIFEDGIGRARRMGKCKTDFFLALQVGFILAVVVCALIVAFY